MTLAVAAGLAMAALLTAMALGTSEGAEEALPPPPDVAFMQRTGLALRFVEQHDRLPVSSREAAETGGRGAPAHAWLVVVFPDPAGNGAALPGLMRLTAYVEKSQPLWFVVIDREPDLGDGDPRPPWRKGATEPWFNVAFVDPYTGAYIIGLAGLTDENGADGSEPESTPPG